MKRPRNLVERRDATESVLATLRDKPFDWTTSATCVHLGRRMLVAFGHRAPPVPKFRSALSAKKALKARGCASLTELIDGVLPGARIPPALMLVGDLAVLPGEEGMEAIVVSAGGGTLIGWHGEDMSAMRPIKQVSPDAIMAAWRL